MTSQDGLEYLGVAKGMRKYKARLVVYDKKTGKKHNTARTIYAQTKTAAQAERARLLIEYESKVLGHVSSPGRKRLREVGEAWIATVDSFSTHGSWSSHLKKINAVMGDQWLDSFTPDQLQRFLATVKGTRKDKLAAGVVNSIRDVLVHVFAYAKAQGLRSDNPAAATTRLKTKKTRAEQLASVVTPKKRSLTGEQLPRFFAELRRLHADTFPIVFTQYAIGCRFAEVSELRWPDIDLRTGAVIISRGQSKGRIGPTKNGEPRLTGVGPAVLEFLRKHRLEMLTAKWPEHESLIFPGPPYVCGPKPRSNHWSYSTVRNHIRETFACLGITDMANVTHAARHTMNNHARKLGDDAMLRKVIGHASPEETGTYTELEMGEVIDFASAAEKAMKLGGVVGVTNGVNRGKR